MGVNKKVNEAKKRDVDKKVGLDNVSVDRKVGADRKLCDRNLLVYCVYKEMNKKIGARR